MGRERTDGDDERRDDDGYRSQRHRARGSRGPLDSPDWHAADDDEPIHAWGGERRSRSVAARDEAATGHGILRADAGDSASAGGHGHGHGGGTAQPVSRRSRMVLWLILAPLLLATLGGLIALWPQADAMPERMAYLGEGASVLQATAIGAANPETSLVAAQLDDGSLVEVVMSPEAVAEVGPGDRMRVFDIPEAEGFGTSYVFVDFAREVPLLLLAAAFVLVVVLVARWRGLAAIVGLAGAFATIWGFALPALLSGRPALPVALVTASIVMFIVLYVAHGFTTRTTTALLGTMFGLALTATLAWIATGSSRILGTSTEESRLLFTQTTVDLSDVFVCGLILAGMGVLNDVTITQASAVWELRAVAPGASRRELFSRAMRIGRDHIASTVYTIAFAYVGAALPLLLVLSLTDAPLDLQLTTGEVVEEIVRTLVGSIGLVLAIPATTAIAALVVPGAETLTRSAATSAAQSA
ncbi:putative membrane protein [Agrococcus sp. UYP33]